MNAQLQTQANMKPAAPHALAAGQTGLLQRKCACGGTPGLDGECAVCRKKRLQRQAAQTATTSHIPPIVHDVLHSPGQPLDRTTRAFFEPRFGHDFSQVRIHNHAKAAKAANAVNALAYTVGSNITFATGQYTPQTTSGRKLLAHELAHVIQGAQDPPKPAETMKISQPGEASELAADRAAASIIDSSNLGAEAVPGFVAPRRVAATPMLQRVPAPPTYQSVTGSIDLSKLRFTPIPDFKAGDLTAPLILTPTLVDRSLVHLSWELYDPTDTLIDGFSTLLGHADSRRMSFALQPGLFQAGKAPAGRYTMRLVGRNAAHEPMAYFDRYFFVLAADLSTGTASTNGFGDFTFTQYDKTDGDFAKGIDYVVHIKMNFLPKIDAVTCDEVGFLQVLESSDQQGRSNHRFAGARKEARKTPLNYSVDRAESGPSPFYGTFRNPANKRIQPGTNYTPGKGGHTPKAAELEDHPTWSQVTIDRFETCATCRTGANAGQVYGCVTWGFAVDTAGKVTLMPRSYSTTASDTLKPAVTNWNTWRAAQTTPADFEAAPTLK